ncbi:MAG: hypothetical protein OXI17_07275, partial [Gammaproteobacteria bacterium]|nr:hypothetical protein [Gammaproteobacteria bacterium]
QRQRPRQDETGRDLFRASLARDPIFPGALCSYPSLWCVRANVLFHFARTQREIIRNGGEKSTLCRDGRGNALHLSPSGQENEAPRMEARDRAEVDQGEGAV